MSIYKGTVKVAGNSAVHTHTNKTVIDKFSEVSGVPYYDGNPIKGGDNAFIGTKAEWDALTSSQKAEYDGCEVILTDDYEVQAQVDDTTTGLNKVWSSSKTSSELSGKASANVTKTTTFEVGTTGWTEDTTSQSGTTLYKKQISLTHVYVDTPNVDIGAGTGSVLPTTAQQTAYNLIQYVTVDDTVPCLYLYASSEPSDAFYIKVTGVD